MVRVSWESHAFIPTLTLLFSVTDVYPTSAIRTKCVKIEISENETYVAQLPNFRENNL